MTDDDRPGRYADRVTILSDTGRRIIGAMFAVGLALAVLRAGLPVWLYLVLMAPGLTWGLLIYLDEVPYARAAAAAERLDRRARRQVAYEAALDRARERRRV